jgi:hypothetical protein
MHYGKPTQPDPERQAGVLEGVDAGHSSSDGPSDIGAGNGKETKQA